MKKNRDINMLEGPLLGSVISYTVPIILTGLLQLFFNAADLVVVGRFRGSVSVAAVGATLSVIYLVVNLFIGLATGAGVTVAHALGAGDHEATHKIVHTAIPTAAISGVLLTVIGLFISRPALEWMGTPSDVIDLSESYMKIYFCGMTFSMLYNYGAAILRAAGDTRSPLIFLTISGVANIGLNVFFVAVLGMNVDGVALATSISQAVSAVLVLIALTRRTDATRLEVRSMHIYKTYLGRIMRIGLPAGIQGSLFSISNVLIQSSINEFGSVVMSGNAAAANIEGFAYVCMNSFTQASMNFTGQNVGARNYERVKRVHLTSLACAMIVGIAVGGLFYLLRETLLGFYITDSPEAIGYGALRLLIICSSHFVMGGVDVTSGTLRGLGSSLAPMLASVLGICGFRILWLYTVFALPEFHTLTSLYLSYPISWVLTFLVETLCLIVVYRRRRRRAGM